MTNKRILEKAIQKAIVGGWKPFAELLHMGEFLDFKVIETKLGEPLPEFRFENTRRCMYIYELIFNHHFCKALWGEGELGWWAHIQNMALADDPIKYLGDNL